jgi:hypothetical protein
MAKLGLPTHALEQMQPGICGAGGACGGTATLKPAIGSRVKQTRFPKFPNCGCHCMLMIFLTFWTGCE